MKRKRTPKFDKFYKLYRFYVYNLCRCRSKNEDEARNLESIVWAEVYRHFERFECDDPRGLLYQLISWRAKDLFRQKIQAMQEGARIDMEDSKLIRLMEKSQEKAISREDKISLNQALSDEVPEDRNILFGRFVEGLTWEELASRHDLHRNTLLKRVKGSLKRLRSRLEETYPLEQSA